MMGGRRLLGIVVTVGMALGAGLLCSATAAAAPPAWRIDALSNTTTAAGGTLDYLVQVTNGGFADSDGSEIDVVATLPAGVTAVSTADASAGASFSCSGPGNSAVAGASVVTCAETDVVPRDGVRTIRLTVAVALSASGSITSSFEVAGGGGPSASTVDPTRIAAAPPGFGVDAFDGQVTANPVGDPFTQAAGHPFAASTEIDLNTVTNPNPPFGPLWPVEPAKDLLIDLPAGFIANPTVTAQCSAAELANAQGAEPEPLCPQASQVGTTLVRLNDLPEPVVLGPLPVFNMEPAPGEPARFGFNVAGTVVTLDAQFRSDSDYGLTLSAADLPQALALAGISLTLWGTPSDPLHDAERGCPGQLNPWRGGPTCSSGARLTAMLRNTTYCGNGLPTTLSVDSWTHPDAFQSATFSNHAPPGYPSPPSAWGAQLRPTGCDKVPFDPTLTVAPASPAQAGQPDAFSFDLNLPQSYDTTSIGESDLRQAVMALPEGMRVSPVGSNGFAGCSPDEIGLDTTDEPTCPDASTVGSATIATPLFDQPLTGSVYLAMPDDNPFGSALAIYLVAEGPGLIVKLPLDVEADPDTGQLTAAFDDFPQLPISDLQLQLSGGPHAWMALPDACGQFATHALATSWSGRAVASESDFTVSQGAGGGPCPTPPPPPPPTPRPHPHAPAPAAAPPPAPFAPAFAAGTANPVAGASASFHVQVTRTDRDQQLGVLSVDLPTGLLGKIAGTVLCPAGAANTGACPGASRLGDATVGAGGGAGARSTSTGPVYITGPYKGSPFGLSIVVPAAAGPFALGSMVVRAAIDVDRRSAQLHVVSDPLPTTLHGVALDLREVRVAVDKPRFVVNPTSCGVKHVLGTVNSVLGAIAHVSTRFQVAGCAKLAFAPKLALTVGAAHRTKAGTSTPLSATLTQTPGQTNLRSVTVGLPRTLRAGLPDVKRACSLASYDAGRCAANARVGVAVAVTPLLRKPLRGRVYLVKNPARATPDLMVALRGAVSLDLTGKVSISRRGRVALSFDTLPDAAIATFTLRLGAGGSGPVRIAADLCAAKAKAATASVRFRGQDGRVLDVGQALHIDGCRRG